MSTKKKLTWHSEVIKVADLKENPNNPKVPDAKGKRRLLKSVNKWGIVTGGVCNADNMLIDGHSRKDIYVELGIKEVEVRKPSRLLSEAEYKEMNAMFDLAKGGDTDLTMVEEILTEEVLDEWEFEKKEESMKPETVDLKPYKRTHILLSFPPEKMGIIQEYLQKITDHSFVEYEQSNN